MSEPQAEYDTEDSQPTLRPLYHDPDDPRLSPYQVYDRPGEHSYFPVCRIDSGREHPFFWARFFAAAGTAASELPHEYDAVEAVEALPVIVKVLEETLWSFEKYNLNKIADRIRGVLNKARGHTDE